MANETNKAAREIQCNNVIDCPDGSDESPVYSNCENMNGNCTRFHFLKFIKRQK